MRISVLAGLAVMILAVLFISAFGAGASPIMVAAGVLGASDREQLAYAHAERRVVVTHDSDFPRLHREGCQHAGIAYCEQRTRMIGQLVAIPVLMYEALVPNEMEGQLEFL